MALAVDLARALRSLPAGLDSNGTFRTVYDRYFSDPLDPEYHPTAAWGHLTGYSAFYYTYVWSLVIARDLLTPFRAKGTLTDPEAAARYAREILTPGSTRPATQLVRAYLGRDFDFRAFEEWSREGIRPEPLGGRAPVRRTVGAGAPGAAGSGTEELLRL